METKNKNTFKVVDFMRKVRNELCIWGSYAAKGMQCGVSAPNEFSQRVVFNVTDTHTHKVMLHSCGSLDFLKAHRAEILVSV
jgi:hypothetical protein